MNHVAVDTSRLTGFKLDLQDVAATASSNAARFNPSIALTTGTSGLLANLTSPLEKFRSAYSSALQSDTTTMDTIGTNLTTSATSYQATDGATAAALAAATDSAAGNSDAAGTTRFGGLQLPSLPDVADEQFTLKQLVTSTISLLSPYDEPLSVALGIKPTEEYLTPLLADWESVETIGRRIAMLGTNDYVASQNIINGSNWLTSEWSGEAAQSFTTTSHALGQTMDTRSTDLDSTAKIVENGGICLERLVFNQVMDLSSRILEAIVYRDASFPLGAWAAQVNDPLPGDLKSQITTGTDELRNAAETRKNAITTVLDKITTALDYSPGRAAPVYNTHDFELPDRVVGDSGNRKYGIGNTVWWKESADNRV
ncbi:hypothetical protein [Nocardia lasii]|uniref:Uncharacterized protein n=1 Tax=Nocardia lasii TaxID=1616107 RepID=A0ABW1JYB6_9NOCA